MLLALKKTQQSQVYHPEGNVWNHTMMVLDYAAKVKPQSKDPDALLWAALLHDIGKPATTKIRKGKITAYNHEKTGAVLAAEFLSELTQNQLFIEGVVSLIKYHMQILYVVKGLPFADISATKEHADIFEVALLGFCDRMGARECRFKRRERKRSIHFYAYAM